MAKYRHRTFEMFDFIAEATGALASKSTRSAAAPCDPDSWALQRLTASCAAGVIHLKFKTRNRSGEEALRELRSDFTLLGNSLVNDSRVLMDFEGLREFCADSIEALADFNRKLQSKGSRMALCNLEPAVQASFFPNR